MPGKKPQYKVLSPRMTEASIEKALLDSWDEGYELSFVVPETGPRAINVFFILQLRKK